jgi:hypothetical protein
LDASARDILESNEIDLLEAVIVFPAGLGLFGRIETEQENDQDKDDWCYAHGLFDHRQKIAAARKPSRTPSNGLETANQKETRQPDS